MLGLVEVIFSNFDLCFKFIVDVEVVKKFFLFLIGENVVIFLYFFDFDILVCYVIKLLYIELLGFSVLIS